MAGSSGNLILPLGVAAVLGLGALWAVAQGKRGDRAAPAAERSRAPRPFEDMPPEELPEHMRDEPFGGGEPEAGEPRASAPEGLSDDAEWKRALELAAEAEAHYAAAVEAKTAGDRERLNEEGKRARALFDQALESTALWEEELLSSYGETDPQVRAIKGTRSKWFDRTRWLHKSVAR